MMSRSVRSRRTFLQWQAASAGMFIHAFPTAGSANTSKLIVTGQPVPELKAFDDLMTQFLLKNEVPGAALAISSQGKIIYERGFGFRDVERKMPVQPETLFRIASVSKPITAVAMLQLVSQGKCSLETPVLDLLRPVAKIADASWSKITIRHCLQHTGGWDSAKSFDPVARPWHIAKQLGVQPPVRAEQIVEFMQQQPLDFIPGERFAYSNFGYLLLGLVIENISRKAYETHVKQMMLKPLNIHTMQLGRARLEQRAENETRYYDPLHRTGPALYPPHVGEQVPLQYGAENFEAFAAHGGWIASAVDLVRLATAFDDPNHSPLLPANLIQEMWKRPEGLAGSEADGTPKEDYYGCGWSVRPTANGKLNSWHSGGIAGSEALLVRRFDGWNWAVLFNTSRHEAKESLVRKIDGQLHAAVPQ